MNSKEEAGFVNATTIQQSIDNNESDGVEDGDSDSDYDKGI
jgi:hypothetical protein